MGQVLYETHFTLPREFIYYGLCAFWFGMAHPILHWAARTFNFTPTQEFEQRTTMAKWVTWVFFIPVSLVVLFPAIFQAASLREDYRNGDYLTVEGYVEDFATRYHEFMGEESFTVDGVYFCYKPEDDLPGTYHYVRASNKGVITGNGQYLKIGYVEREDFGDKLIIYIEELLPSTDAMEANE